MSLSPAFLDQLRSRTTLSALIGKTVKVTKAGREFKACCPFHDEKTPSFTVNDEKAFYHCFSCGAHGDAIRWLTDRAGLSFIDAVRQLADAAGMDVPAPTPQMAARLAARETVADVLDRAGRWYGQQLVQAGAVTEQLFARGVDLDMVARFGLGLAPARLSVRECGADLADLRRAGLIVERDGPTGPQLRDWFYNRIMIPIHDARGRAIGFGARVLGSADGGPKYINSADSDHFDKGRTLYNHHRAAPSARSARRLVVVEGYFDVIGLAGVGIAEAVAPMGTAITEHQFERAWRISERVILLFDGDAAGRKAAMRAVERALPMVGPGRNLAVGLMPDGQDPDDVARAGGRAAVDAVIDAAEPVHRFLFARVVAEGLGDATATTPEARAAVWQRLAGMAATITDAETQAQYLADWRAAFDAAFPPPPPWSADAMLPGGTVEALAALHPKAAGRCRSLSAAWWVRQQGRGAVAGEDAERLAYRVASRIAAGLFDGDADARDAMRGVVDQLTDGQDAGAVARSWEAGTRRPYDLTRDLLTLRCAGFPQTDLGNAERFHARFGEAFRFTTAKGWLGWDGRRWAVLDQDEKTTPSRVLEAVFDTIRAIQYEGAAIAETGMRDDPDVVGGMDKNIQLSKERWTTAAQLLRDWGRTSESAGKLGCIAGLAKRWITVPIEDFDNEPMAFNVQNGTLRFTVDFEPDEWGQMVKRAAVTLHPHDRADLNTKVSPVAYDADAACPVYDAFLIWAQPDAAVRRYLHRWVGYSMTGDVSAQELQFHYGLGANGKSTAFDLWSYIAGDYGGSVGIETFLDQGQKRNGGGPSPDLAQLGGVRLLRASEPARGAKLNEALIKAATGGEPMSVRFLNRGFFELRPLFKLMIAGNYKPDVPGTDEGIWRRLKLIPWDSHKPKDEQDPGLPAKLRAEAQGVLRAVVAGVIDWLERGLATPQVIMEATQAYRDDSDPLARFLRLCTVPNAAARVQSSKLYDVFAAWCKAASEREWSQKGFSKAMLDKGFSKKASNGMQWAGLELTKSVGDFVDHEGKVRTQEDDLATGGAGPAVGMGDDDDVFFA